MASKLHRWHQFLFCLSFFTRIPVSAIPYDRLGPLATTGWAFPLVGFCLGLISALIAGLLYVGQAPAFLISGAVLLTHVICTGALHEDGLSDVCDSLGIKAPVSRKLEIMRDSATGVYGLIGLSFSLSLRFAALLYLSQALVKTELSFGFFVLFLLLVPMVSRCLVLLAMARPGAPNGASKGLGKAAGTAGRQTAILWSAALLLLSWLVSGSLGCAVLPFAAGYLAYRHMLVHVGGMTGDAYGYVEQITHISALVAFAWLGV